MIPFSFQMRLLWATISFLIIMHTSGCAQSDSSAFDVMVEGLLDHSVPEFTVEAFKNADQASFLILDAREPREFEVSHLPNARCVGYDELDLSAVEHLDKTQPILVYCSVGYRSEKVAEKLKAAGFQAVYNLYGGIFDWTNQGLKVVDSSGQMTERVHGFSPAWGIWVQHGEVVYDP
ncbi:rhodanese-like domain-containing protein [Pontibacter sp. G13]|uniref:rhodanese-like domain-containing protein n=1 Tax=Pontibacter sp. G13 TaxID=3074898 RepID=UPI00288C4142|nr:rhodanese-like domain-containing protein [Pontibacter sp. G13]WNJ16416.1 rhodanese-like domain-containing protein [Pontibacter sp. G13]